MDRSPRAGAGVAMIYQELNLAPDLTVEENITLGIEEHTLGVIRPSPYRRRVRAVLAQLNHPDIRPGGENRAIAAGRASTRRNRARPRLRRASARDGRTDQQPRPRGHRAPLHRY